MTAIKAACLLAFFGLSGPVEAQTLAGTLPPGTSLGEDRLSLPRRAYYSELRGGVRSPQSVLGELLFEAPSLFGGTARTVGMSCGTCHIEATNNPELFIPGLSSRPGTFDPAGPIFSPQTDTHALNALTVPSLRGIRFLAPFGHDGRFATLREFTRNAIVNEFAGSEPSPSILDALLAFMQDIAPLPNHRLAADGRLVEANEAERRGELLFVTAFPNNPSLTCATCHVPSALFVDHQQHDVGAGLYKTPTLRNANFNAPYFHDGRFNSYDQVVDHFDNWYGLNLKLQDKGDLVNYLKAVGDAEEPYEQASAQAALAEAVAAAPGLQVAVRQREWSTIALAADGLAHKLHAIQRYFLTPQGADKSDGITERSRANAAIADVILEILHLQQAAEDRNASVLDQSLLSISHLLLSASAPLAEAEKWSLFNPEIMMRHRQALSEINGSGPVRNPQ
jgi:hypothetical protein